MASQCASNLQSNLVWLDLEMTGLNPDRDEILEMAIVVTDLHLNVVAESSEWVFYCEENKLEQMDSWNQQTHGGSGLIDLVRDSKLDYATGEADALNFLSKWVTPQQSPLCGNTICQDRRFLAKHMAKLNDYFHYRNFDVTVFKLAADYWMSSMPSKTKKNNRHRAKADIHESIEEMAYFHNLLFKR